MSHSMRDIQYIGPETSPPAQPKSVSMAHHQDRPLVLPSEPQTYCIIRPYRATCVHISRAKRMDQNGAAICRVHIHIHTNATLVHVHIATSLCIFSTHFFYRVARVLCLCVCLLRCGHSRTPIDLFTQNRTAAAAAATLVLIECAYVCTDDDNEWQTGRGTVQRYRTQPEPIICSNSVHKRNNAAQRRKTKKREREGKKNTPKNMTQNGVS